MEPLAPFVCGACGAPVPVPDAESIVCAHCGQLCVVPEEHRRAAAALRAEDAAVLRAQIAWARFARTRLPPWVPLAAGIAPTLVFLSAFVFCALTASSGAAARARIGWTMFTPLAPLYAIYAVLGAYAETQKYVAPLRSSLAARPGEVPCCRTCGAPLFVPDGRIVVRCLYCETDNLVEISAADVCSLETGADAASRSLVAALDAVRLRVRRARRGLGIAALVFGVMSILPLSWAFAAGPWGESGPTVLAFAVWFPLFFLLLLPLALLESWGSELRRARGRAPFTHVVERGTFACLGASVVLAVLFYALAARANGS